MNRREARPVTVVDRVGAALFRLASTLFSALPRWASMGLAHGIGRLAFHLLGSRRRVALSNVEIAMGDELGPKARAELAKRSFGHSVGIAMDLLTLPKVTRDPSGHCEVPAASLAALEAANAEGKGVIMVAGHFGMMESMGIRLGDLGYPVSFVAKAFGNRALDAAVNARRGATGNGFIHKGGAMEKLRSHLAGKGRVAVVVDQHVNPHDRLWIPFFGIPAATTRALGTLAVESGAPILPIHAFPIGGGRCRCEFGPVLHADSSGDPIADAETTVIQIIEHMEEATRRQPEAWMWVHRRWKVRPDGYDGPRPEYSETETEEAARWEARVTKLNGGASRSSKT